MKKKLLIVIAVVLVAVVAAVGLTACVDLAGMGPDEIKEYGTLVIATNAEFEPFEYFDKDGKTIIGWDMDIARELARLLGVKVDIQHMEFDSVLSAVSTGRAHIAMAGISINPTRDETVDFSENVFDSTQMIIVRSDNTDIQDAFDLEGKVVGGQNGTVGLQLAQMSEDWAYDFDDEGNVLLDSPILGKPAQAKGFQSGALAVTDLINGKLDAVILDKYPAEAIVSKAENAGKVKILETPVFEDAYAFAVSEGNKALADWINSAIAEMKESGFWEQNMTKYFG
ncbi:MAG TPA: transporter substrate-binding domain-containing protein [Candidatus Caccalectryoclostridium excrementigallinarum]|uniref:Transporter substrate-binding domain-containing protein n=1 Tax=Candidatus Caccalectryoclostridium excrementigallinarum TaxID=2840710 RepID=A0A9D1MMM3_9FIRM|nr:transporter substrate-binding domain-containing protein [Candidatus Caccalectryoclostridium excrementigallinarum]